MKIKPQFDQEDAKIILRKFYGIKALEICELNAYDDKNFLIFADKYVFIFSTFDFFYKLTKHRPFKKECKKSIY